MQWFANLSSERHFCSDYFFDVDDTWGASLKFSDCFQLSLLTLPAVYLVFLIAIKFFTRNGSKYFPVTLIKFGCVQSLRSILLLGICVCILLLLISTTVIDRTDAFKFDVVYFIGPTVLCISFVIYGALCEHIRRVHQPRSEILFVFVILAIFCVLPRFFTLAYGDNPHYLLSQIHLYTLAVYICLSFGEFILHFFTPHTRQNSLLKDKAACPILWVSTPSKWTFSWLFSTIWRAYKKQINKPEDVFNICPTESVDFNVTLFQNSWRRVHKEVSQDKQQCVELDSTVGNHFSNDLEPLLSSTDDPEIAFRADPTCLEVDPVPGAITRIANKDGKNYSWLLFSALCRTFGLRLLGAWLLISMALALNYLLPILLGLLIRFLSAPNSPSWQGYFVATSMLIIKIISTVVDQQGFFNSLNLGISIRSTLTSAVYRKALRLSSEARTDYTTGEVVNLISVDVNRIMECFMFSFLILTAMFDFTLSFVLLWHQLGIATLAGIGILLILIPFNLFFMWITQKLEVRELHWKDRRIKCLSELFAAIRVIKLYAWERAFEKQVNVLRNSELLYLLQSIIGWSIARLIWNLAPYFILLATFVTYSRDFLFGNYNVTLGNQTLPQILTPERIFVSVNLFNLIRGPLVFLPWILSSTIMAIVSIRRIGKFLSAEELDFTAVNYVILEADDGMPAVSFDNASFSWSRSGQATLRNMNLHILHGWLVAIVGSVGSGKSSFLSACLGDMVKRSGAASVRGKLAFMPQTAWIQQLSLRDNICFTTKYDQSQWDKDIQDENSRVVGNSSTHNEVWYRKVVSACALDPDIKQLPAGDRTEIGERGVNLSGGQRQRVSLARAVYQDCDVYLLDDPLSAVDSHVSKHLFNEVLGPNGLLKSKTRIITTNSFYWLNQANWIIVLDKDGRITQSGPYDVIVNATSGQFTNYLKSIEMELAAKVDSKDPQPSDSHPTTGQDNQLERRHSIPSSIDAKRSCTVPITSQKSANYHSSLTSKLSLSPPKLLWDDLPTMETGGRLYLSSSFDNTTTRHDNISLRSEDGSHSPKDLGHRESIAHTQLDKTSHSNEMVEVTSDRGDFIADEAMSSDRVPWSAYRQYFSACGTMSTLFMVLSYCAFLTVQAFSNYWLQWFADDQSLARAEQLLQNVSIFTNETARHELMHQIHNGIVHYITGYFWLGIAHVVATIGFVIFLIIINYRASKLLHRKLLVSVLHAPINFFDHTPIGRILNRFSNHIDNLDHSVPNAFSETVCNCADLFISFLVIIITLKPIGTGLLIIMPTVILCASVLIFYLPCARQARRLDANTRSVLLANFSETAASSLGASVVRAFKLDTEFIRKSDYLTNRNSVHDFLRYSSNRWLDVYMSLICQLMVFGCVLTAVVFRSSFSPGLAGLIVIYAQQVLDSLTWVVKQLSQMETSAVSLERINEYINVEQEADWDHGPDSPVPPNWPQPCCQLTFNKATVQYKLVKNRKPNPSGDDGHNDDEATNHGVVEARSVTALRSIDLKLSGSPTERRIGIVGRTGAGKSSLASCVFRLTEAVILPEELSNALGPIVVDGVDIARIGLHELRSRFSILPQDPVIFAGSLRFNLDPFKMKTDSELWDALESAHLAGWVRSTDSRLDYECGEGGAHLSVGQRQLVCLARVFLSSGGRVRLLILDEATAAMDPITDKLVMQTVIGEKFADATVIIIAHRLSTVMNTDRIVVLDNGRVLESGHPNELLNNPNSHFANMQEASKLT